MNILSMLVRLQGTIGRTDLVSQMVLIPQAKSRSQSESQSRSKGSTDAPRSESQSSSINLVVGYSSSPRSQTALDLTLWIAHQTRLATGKQVTVQVVYVVDPDWMSRVAKTNQTISNLQCEIDQGAGRTDRLAKGRTAIAEPASTLNQSGSLGMADVFEQADRILWQARCLAEEWRGSLETHLRFGSVTEELKAVVESEEASLLILGCESRDHELIQQLGTELPCPVLGIPHALQDETW